MSSSTQQQDSLKKLGNDLVQQREFEEASKFYDRALEIDSTSESSAAIFSNRSLCYLNTKKYSESLQDAEKAIFLRPTWFRGYQRAAAACEKLTNKDERGLKHLEKCFELDETSKDDAILKKMKEDFELNLIKHKAPSMTQDELKQAGNNYIKNQQYQQAIDLYTLAIEKDAFCDEAVPILSNRSMAYFKIGKFKEAYEDGGCCCGIKPEWAKGFMRRGVAAEKLEEWQIALESYDEYLKLDPSDDAGVTTSRNAVAIIVADLKKKEEARQQELKELEHQLAAIANPDERLARSYAELLRSADNFDIERMKITLKQPIVPRLDTPYLGKYEGNAATRAPISVNRNRTQAEVNLGNLVRLTEGDLREREEFSSHFLPGQIQAAREKCREGDSVPEGISLVVEHLLFVLGNRRNFEDVPMSRQVEYLDFILDTAEEQSFNSPPGTSVLMECRLRHLCWYDPVNFLQHKSIRKDLIITLFNRIDTARLLFKGKSATNKDFCDLLLYHLCSDFDPRSVSASLYRNSAFASEIVAAEKRKDNSQDLCTQNLYECISMALQHGADPNKRHQVGSSGRSMGTGHEYALHSAVTHLGSAKVVELLLRHNADPNAEMILTAAYFDKTTSGYQQASVNNCRTLRMPNTPLSLAFLSFRPDIIRALLRFNAKLPRQDLPDVVLKLFPPAKNPLVKPQYTPTIIDALAKVVDKPVLAPRLTHEYIGLLFEAVTSQDLSFLCPNMNRDGFHTPLTYAIRSQFSVDILEFMIKLKPAQIQTFCVPNLSEGFANTPLTMLVQFAAWRPAVPIDYYCSAAKLLSMYGADCKREPGQYRFDQRSGNMKYNGTSEDFLESICTAFRPVVEKNRLQSLKQFIFKNVK